jgi:cytochrome c553
MLALLILLLTTPGARAAPAFEDSIAQRTLACTGCHGQQGRAASDGYYPRLAGKPAGYLYNQLRNFREGRRHYSLMSRLLDNLGDDYLREIAQHFSSLEVPYPAPQPALGPASARERGQSLVTAGDQARNIPACASCHGKALTGMAPAIPGLLGLPRDYISAQLGAWQTGQRRAHAPDCMARIAGLLDAQDIHAVAGWLSAQPVPAGARAAAPLGAPMVMDCGSLEASTR